MRVLAGRIGVVLERDLGVFHDGFLTGRIAFDVELHETAGSLLWHLIVILAFGDALQGIVLRDVDAFSCEFHTRLVGRQGRDAAHIGAVLVLGHSAMLDGADEQVEIVVFQYRLGFRFRFGLRCIAADSHSHHRNHRDGQDDKEFFQFFHISINDVLIIKKV